MAGLKDRIARLMNNKPTAEWTADFRKRLDENGVKIAEHEAIREQAAFEAQLGDPAAQAKMKDLDVRLAHFRRHAAELQGAINQAEAREREEKAQAEREAQEARIRSIADLSNRRLDAVRAVELAAERLSSLMREADAIGPDLANAVGTTAALRAFGTSAFSDRLTATLANVFTIDPAKPWVESNNFLRLAINGANPMAKSTLFTEEEKAIYDLTAKHRRYVTREEADKFAAVLNARGDTVAVLEDANREFHVVSKPAPQKVRA